MGQDFVQGDQEDKENQPPIVIRTVRKDITLKMFLEETVKEYNTSSDFFRFWILLNRDGQTVRLGILPTEEEQNMSKCLEILYAITNLTISTGGNSTSTPPGLSVCETVYRRGSV